MALGKSLAFFPSDMMHDILAIFGILNIKLLLSTPQRCNAAGSSAPADRTADLIDKNDVEQQ